MMNKKILFISIFVFMIVLSIGAVSAEQADDAIASSDDDIVLEGSEPTSSGTVSGGVDVVTEHPWSNSGELSYDIPSDAKNIKSADVYVNVYGLKLDDTYGINADISVKTDKGEQKYNESLSYAAEDKYQVYNVNDHVTKSNLDYMIHYNITSLLNGLNGTNLKINVNTSSMPGKQTANNVGYIKLIGLVLTYDDGDDDVINYWINDNQIFTSSNTTLTFDTASLTNVLEMYITDIALVSSDATYLINEDYLNDAEHKSGSYYRYNKWDITDKFSSGKKINFTAVGGVGSYGVSYKNALTVLTAKTGVVSAAVSAIATERSGSISGTSMPIVYPGLTNKITVTVNTNKNGKYVVKLLANGVEVNSTEIYLTSGSTPVTLIDNTIRPVTDASIYTGADGTYDKINYTAQLFQNGEQLSNKSVNAVILYNGYFNKALYNQNSLEAFYNGTITGDIVIETSGLYATKFINRTDSWTVSLKDNSVIVKAFIYVSHTAISGDNINMLNATFNNKTLTPIAFIRDQVNAVGNGGYGVLVYDVTDDIKNGNNSLEWNRKVEGGIYPSTLVYLYNTTGSKVVKNVYISNGADVLGAYGNGDRKLKIDSTFSFDTTDITNATVYILSAGSNDPGRASISINGVLDDNVWNTTEKDVVKVYTKDITSIMKNSNDISVILNKGMFLALQQIIVTTKAIKEDVKPAPAPSPAPAPVKITKKATKITAKKKTFKAKTKVKKYTITLKSGKKPVKKVQVTIKIGKKTFKAKTNSKGKATFKIKKLTKKGKYVAVIKFKGDKTYKASSKKVKITVKK